MSGFDEIFGLAVAKMQKGQHKKFVLLVGEVTEVNEADDTCTVGDYEEVRLNSVIDTMESKFTVYPKKGSQVLIGRLEDSDAAVVISCSEIDKVVVRIKEQRFEMADGKFVIKNEKADLKKILNDGLSQLQQAIITTPSGPGNFSPADVQKFSELQEKVNQLFS